MNNSLHRHSCKGDYRSVINSIENGANINAVCHENGKLAIHCACEFDHINVAIALINRGSALNTLDSFGWTPLMYACDNDSAELVDLLVSRGAAINIVYWHNQTALMYAAESGRMNSIRALLRLGCDINYSLDGVGSAFAYAIHNGNLKVNVYEFLLSNGAQVNAPIDDNGNTALHIACLQNRAILVQLLLAYGADVTATNVHNRRPDELAANAASEIIIRFADENVQVTPLLK